MSHFHSLKVRELKKETNDAVTISFDIPKELKEEFHFKPGQHLTIRMEMDGNEIRRSYSICTAPHEDTIKVAVKKIDSGLFSNFANLNLKKGHTLDVMAPLGRFSPNIDPDKEGNYLLIAAGSGITPIISILKTVLYSEPKSNVTLIYGNRNTRSIMFKEELEDLKNIFLERLTLYFLLSREKLEAPILSGRIDKEKLQLYFDKVLKVEEYTDAFLCGPEGMVLDAKSELLARGMPEKKVHLELFTTPGQTPGSIAIKDDQIPSFDPSSESMVSLKLDGKTYEFSLKYNAESLLDAALGQGADLPYACKGGVCCTCRAKLVEGEVDMTVNFGLEHDEVEAGFILTCQSHPRSEKLIVDFDIK